MSQETHLQQKAHLKYQRPSERAARLILGIFGFFKDMFTSPATVIPRGKVFQHQGYELSAGKAIRFPHILLVEDNPNRAEEFIEVIKNYYVFGSVKILTAHAFDSAVNFFANEDVNLVIMDADLDDDHGDGAILTQMFLKERPDLTILANSSRGISNLKLTGLGAIGSLGKNTAKFMGWLLINDPAGSDG